MINHLIEKIKTYVDLNTDEFIVDFLGLKKKGYNRCVCPFCEHKDAGMSYFKSGFWGCYHANCEANGGAGDSITLATLVLNGHTPETYKRLSAENKKQLFIDTIQKLKTWIGEEKLANLKVNKKYSKSLVSLDANDEKIKIFFEKIFNKTADGWDVLDFNRTLMSIESEKRDFLVDEYKKMMEMDFETYDDVVYHFISKANIVNLDVIFHLKPLYKILQQNYYAGQSDNYVKNVIKKCFKPSSWPRFSEEQRKKFRIFDADFINKDCFELTPIRVFGNYHFYPIFDESNKLVGLQGRVKELSEITNKKELEFRETLELPKCLNLRNFERNKVIYNLNNVINTEQPYLVIHEGPADVIAADSFGINAISFLGKTISSYQFELLKKYYGKDVPIFIALDNDSAGKVGALQMAEMLKEFYNKIYIVTFKDFNDPSEATKEQYISNLRFARRVI